MTDAENREPDWQASLEHHEDLCSERYEAIHKDIQSLRDEMRSSNQSIRDEVGNLRDEMRGNIQSVRDEVGNLRDEMRGSNQTMRDDIRELRIGQRWIVGVMLTWPPLIIASLKWIPW